MKIQYWGTAAAEAFPAIFCTCDTCRRARAAGGKNIRTRASALINDAVMLDFSPDTNMNRLRYQYDMSRLQSLCITHAHIDHLAAAELLTHAPNPYCRGSGAPLPVFCGKDAKEHILNVAAYDGTEPALAFTEWKPFHKEQVADHLWITPLPAKHDPHLECYIFLIEDEQKKFLYAHDTAMPEDCVFDFLRGYQLDGISLDCNNGAQESGKTHMGLADAVLFARKLEQSGSIREGALRIINHFSHACDLLYDELCACASPYHFQVSWDGMTVEI